MARAALAAKAPEERRERIMLATIAVVRERGFAGTRVADIALEAGTSQGLVLYHFGSLAGALAACLTMLEDEFYDDFAHHLAAEDGPVERLRFMAELAAGSSAAKSVLRLAALMDGLAVQLALNEPGMTTRKFTELWWESAVLELGITEPAKRGKSPR